MFNADLYELVAMIENCSCSQRSIMMLRRVSNTARSLKNTAK